MQIKLDFLDEWMPSNGEKFQRYSAGVKNIENIGKLFEELIIRSNNIEIDKVFAIDGDNEEKIFKKMSEQFNSDKGSNNLYQWIHDQFLPSRNIKRSEVKAIMEIGVGSKNVKIPGHFASGTPSGNSLRVLKNIYYNSEIHGVDIDRDVLFEDERIKCFYADQLNYLEFISNKNFFDRYNIIIDDGAHLISSNLCTLLFAMDKLSPGGCVIIEDIPPSSLWMGLLVKQIFKNIEWESFLFDQDNIPLSNGYCLICVKPR